MRLVLWSSICIGVTAIAFLVVVVTLVFFVKPDDGFTLVSTERYNETEQLKDSEYTSQDSFLSQAMATIKDSAMFVLPVLSELPSLAEVNMFFKPVEISEKERLDFTALSQTLNMSCKQYEVITEDGYVLQLFRVQGSNTGSPVLLVHGFLDSADTFILRGSTSLTAALVSAGRDVWLANLRGNKYSRRHLSLDAEDLAFWNFSFHEFGYYDLPAIIDRILQVTNYKRLQAIGYSQGTTAFLVMGSTRPEYNDKVEVLLAMGPLCHLKNIESPLDNLMVAEAFLNAALRTIGREEIFGNYSQILSIVKQLCLYGVLGRVMCLEGGFYYLFGRDEEEIQPDFLPLLFGHFPAGTSLKNMNHLSQTYLTKSFSKYDYGIMRNLIKYMSLHPPSYDLSDVSMKIAMFVGPNDKLSTLEDNEILRQELPNVVEYRVMERRKFNHLDFVWGKNMKRYLFPQIMEILDKYNT